MIIDKWKIFTNIDEDWAGDWGSGGYTPRYSWDYESYKAFQFPVVQSGLGVLWAIPKSDANERVQCA